MEFLVVVGVAVAATVALMVLRRARQRRIAMRRLLAERGWSSVRDGETTIIAPADNAWALRMTQSFAAQQNSSTRIVTTTWSAASPCSSGGAVIAGPTPPEPMRQLAVQLIGSIPPDSKVGGWLGLARVGNGEPLRHLPSVDARLLALATGASVPLGSLSGVADAVQSWTTSYSSERAQPTITFDSRGVLVRVRVDVLKSVDQLVAFVDLAKSCAASLATFAR